ncbi:MAG: ATP-binding protein [Dysgonamonadaceae bacterium]|nr:ATP-binding protein [Dysgonamonadaceae bacterium]
MGHLEQIIMLSEKMGLNDEFFQKAKRHINAANKLLKISRMQAVFFAHFVGNSDNATTLNDLATSIYCSKIRILQYMHEIDELEKRHLIRRYVNRYRGQIVITYQVPQDVMQSLVQNKEYQPVIRKNISIDEVFDVLNQRFKELCDNELTYEQFINEINALLEDNPHLCFTQNLKQYGLPEAKLVLLLRFCNLFVENEDDNIRFHNIENCFPDSISRQIKQTLRYKCCNLFTLDLIKNNNDNGFENRESFRLTDKAKTELLGELNIEQKQARMQKDLTFHTSLASKQLFYNEKERKQVAELTALLQEEHFANVRKHLTDKGMRTGFACLFHGAPGTGKTETVYQIARQTERNIYLVDISATKSMWFGESEKRIKRIFEQYRELVKSEKIAPILLFNEADAVIGKRKDVISGNVTQTENAIQNIILQEMETLDGIMIATTNLTQNLDKAFERRFLYKIEFVKPNVDAKRSIWQSIIPELSETDAATLANRYDFSGGQIENIARKATIDSIIGGKEPDLAKLEFHCKSELIGNGHRAVGFRTG